MLAFIPKSSSTRRQQDELITLSSDEETGSNSGAVQLEGEPEVQVILDQNQVIDTNKHTGDI